MKIAIDIGHARNTGAVGVTKEFQLTLPRGKRQGRYTPIQLDVKHCMHHIRRKANVWHTWNIVVGSTESYLKRPYHIFLFSEIYQFSVHGITDTAKGTVIL